MPNTLAMVKRRSMGPVSGGLAKPRAPADATGAAPDRLDPEIENLFSHQTGWANEGRTGQASG